MEEEEAIIELAKNDNLQRGYTNRILLFFRDINGL